MKRFAILIVLVGLGAVWFLALPPPTASTASVTPQGGVRGAIHVHTNRSDGTGSVHEIAAAAARAGLRFVIFTDHGDATREPDPPQYLSNVLCIDAIEISTTGGHLVALGVPQSPYPLGGEARDVVEDVKRLGGFAIAAHPDSMKPELAWTDPALPIDGIEWLNGDSEWRDETRWALVRALFTYPVRPTETLSLMLDRPDPVLREWDQLTARHPVVAVAAADAHARIGLRTLGEPYDSGSSLHVPAYEGVFRLFSNVVPGVTLTGNANDDAEQILSAIRRGNVYSVIDSIGQDGAMSFVARSARAVADMGGHVSNDTPLVLHVQRHGGAEGRIRLLKDGVEVAAASGEQLEHPVDAGTSGVFRVEVSRDGAPGEPPVPWIVTNPIYVGGRASLPPPVLHSAASTYEVQYADGPAPRWSIETSAASRAAIDVMSAAKGTELALRYAVGGAASASPYVAFVLSTDASIAEYDRLVFTARADRAMRLSVQLREPSGADGERWHRSVFVDTEPREITVYFDDLRPLGTSRERPTLASINSVLFVMDTVNTPLGGNGRIWLDDVKFGR